MVTTSAPSSIWGARVEAAGHGGQTLVTDVVRQAAALDAHPLGTFTLRGVGDPVAIFQIGDGEFPPLRVPDAASTNLPSAPTALIGRADDVRAVRTALRSSRLVTLVAGGGAGKTASSWRSVTRNCRAGRLGCGSSI